MRRIFPLLFVVLLLIAVPVGAQTLGTITGEVKDASGAVIPGATVTATNTGTNAAREMPSNEAGTYTFAALPPGPYVVKAELQGFKTVQQQVELHVEQTVRVNFTMEIGTLSETAEVTGVAPLITTENATVGTVIENRRIVELPLNGRNFLSLVALSPNVSAEFAGAGQAGDRQGGSRANQQLSISGQRREFNYYTLDGTDNTDVNFNTYILLPSVDALEEFKVQTGIYSAEFGRAASQVNVVTKSGTNQFHGTIFEFHRNDALRLAALLVLGRTGGPAEAPVQVEPVRLHRWRSDLDQQGVLHVELGRVPRPQTESAELLTAVGRLEDRRFLVVLGAAVRSGHLHRRQRFRSEDVRDVPRQPDSGSAASTRRRRSCSSSIPSRTPRAPTPRVP